MPRVKTRTYVFFKLYYRTRWGWDFKTGKYMNIN